MKGTEFKQKGGINMKSALIGVLAFALVLGLAMMGTDGPYIYNDPLDVPQPGDYQGYWNGDTFVFGPNQGFGILESGSTLHVFTRILDADIYLLTTADVFAANTALQFGSTVLSDPANKYEGTGQFDGYIPLPYYGINLERVFIDSVLQAGWASLPSDPFQPEPYYVMDVDLFYSDGIPAGSYIFAVADDNGYPGLQANGSLSPSYGPDKFSPKTSSAVPEPSTLSMLISGGLIFGLAVLRRRRS
jgi:hypothetical protein